VGLIVARFGLLPRELGAMNSHRLPADVTTAFGVALTLCGVIVLLLSLQRYRTVGKREVNLSLRNTCFAMATDGIVLTAHLTAGSDVLRRRETRMGLKSGLTR
jgi:hypothetical protein